MLGEKTAWNRCEQKHSRLFHYRRYLGCGECFTSNGCDSHSFSTIVFHLKGISLEQIHRGSYLYADLTELPRKLRTLDLWNNRIQQSVIFFGQIPPNLIYVEFHLIGGGNRIDELRGTSTENAKKLGKLFPGHFVEAYSYRMRKFCPVNPHA